MLWQHLPPGVLYYCDTQHRHHPRPQRPASTVAATARPYQLSPEDNPEAAPDFFRGKQLAVGDVKQSVYTGAGKKPEREGGQETTVTVLAIFLFIIGTLLVLIGTLLILIGTFLIIIGATLILIGMTLIAVGAFLLIRKLLGRDRTKSHSW
ncbi:hypothetical protein [Streptomyces sp. NPDC047453]|uniref:hypothetical protein n=1 Tax=Streptomyces sp. NPDC047453 TaxID=3154812 RepID=UPI0033FF30E6